MPAHFIQGSFDPFAKPRWGLTGASLAPINTAHHNKECAHAAHAGGSEWMRVGSGETDNSSQQGEWGWIEKTVGLRELAYVIGNLTEGAKYQVEVEACAKYVGPVLAALPTITGYL